MRISCIVAATVTS